MIFFLFRDNSSLDPAASPAVDIVALCDRHDDLVSVKMKVETRVASSKSTACQPRLSFGNQILFAKL